MRRCRWCSRPAAAPRGCRGPCLLRRATEIMRAWKTRHLVGFPAYIRHMGLVMRDELKIDPRSCGIQSLIVHLGVEDRVSLQEIWGAKAYDPYGTNECGSLAAEC